MAYPFLPVNPSCTDVVINDVCGCSSVITNSGRNTNNPCSTILTASSTIIYNGPALTCTTAEPCDTLNVILQKIDEIICNLLSQINILTTQVTNINTQVLTINNDISDIYDVLDVCCPVTTTTTTTIFIPCECLTFTNTSNIIVDYNISYNNCIGDLVETTISANEIIKVCGCCGFADNPLVTISIGVNCIEGFCPTTTTTSSTSSTTTTTTTIPPITTTTTTTYPYPCSCVHVAISQTDLDDATGNTPAPGKADNTVYLTTSKNSGCDESNIDTEYTVAGLSGFCIKTSSLSTIQLFYYKNDAPIYFPATASTYNILYASCSVSGECIPM